MPKQELVDGIFKRVKLSYEDLEYVAVNVELACKPDKFINFLKRIPNMKSQMSLDYMWC